MSRNGVLVLGAGYLMIVGTTFVWLVQRKASPAETRADAAAVR